MKAKLIALILVLCAAACIPDPSKKSGTDEGTDGEGSAHTFYLGTYTLGKSQGIYQYEIDAEGRLHERGLKARTENPSFLAWAGDSLLLAVNELEVADSLSARPTASVSLFRRSGDSLLLVDRQPTGGSWPCHLSVHPDGWVVSSNYGGGSLTLFRLDPAGRLSAPLDTLVFQGGGTHPRQEGPHAHSSYFLEDGTGLLALDLGSDAVWRTGIREADSSLVKPFAFRMKKGSGPRHAALHPNGRWLYLLHELTSEVSRVELRNLRDTTRIPQPAYASALPNDYREGNTGAEVRVSQDGRFVYSSNRGHNSIAGFRVSPTRGTLEPLFWQSTGGRTPRNFALTPDDRYLLVANQDSDILISFRRDPGNGTLQPVDTIAAPTPVYFLFD